MDTRGSRIAVARKKLGFTQQKLADVIGVHLTTVANWETGATKPLRYTAQLASALNTTVDWIMNGGSDVPPKISFSHGGFPTLYLNACERSDFFEAVKSQVKAARPEHSKSVNEFVSVHSDGLRLLVRLISDAQNQMILASHQEPEVRRVRSLEIMLNSHKRLYETSDARAQGFRKIMPRLVPLHWFESHQQALDEFATSSKVLLDGANSAATPTAKPSSN